MPHDALYTLFQNTQAKLSRTVRWLSTLQELMQGLNSLSHILFCVFAPVTFIMAPWDLCLGSTFLVNADVQCEFGYLTMYIKHQKPPWCLKKYNICNSLIDCLLEMLLVKIIDGLLSLFILCRKGAFMSHLQKFTIEIFEKLTTHSHIKVQTTVPPTLYISLQRSSKCCDGVFYKTTVLVKLAVFYMPTLCKKKNSTKN